MEGRFPLNKDLKCSDFLGKFQAQVIERSLPKSRMMDADYYELAE